MMLHLFIAILAIGAAQSSESPEMHGHMNDSMQEVEAVEDMAPVTWGEGLNEKAPTIVQSELIPETCINSEQGLVVGSLLTLSPCSIHNTPFKWSRDTQLIQVATKPELCVGLASNSEPISQLLEDGEEGPQSTLLQLQSCTAEPSKQQQWLVEGQHGSMKSKARPDLCIAPDENSLNSSATSAAASQTALKLAYCRHVKKDQGFRYIAVDYYASELEDLSQEHAKQHSKEERTHDKERTKVNYSSHSTEVGATGKLHMKHGRKTSSPPANILNLDISESQVHHEALDSSLMRRDAASAREEERMPETDKTHADTQGAEQKKHVSEKETAEKSDIDALLERISEGLIEEDEDEQLSAEDLDAMLDRAVVAKRRRPPPPPPPPPKIDCSWGRWKKWSDCSAKCGGGTKERERGERIRAQNGGLPCDGDAEQEKQCNSQPCGAPPSPPTAPPSAGTPPPMMAKGGAEGTVSLTPAVFLVMLFVTFQSLRSMQ